MLLATSGIIDFVSHFTKIIILCIPFVVVVWEAIFLQLTGSSRHWRRFGVAMYVSGFSLAIGGIYQMKQTAWDHTVATFLVLFLVGAVMPLVALLVREENEGDLIYPRGPNITRFLGVFTYIFCAYLMMDLVTM